MGSISDFAENNLLDHALNGITYTPPATVYLGLSTADPLDTGAGLAEPVGGGYARKAITFGTAAARAITQSALVQFDEVTAPWGLISHWALFDALSAGNMLAHGALALAKNVVAGNNPSVDAGEVVVSFNAGGFSDYAAVNLLDFMFRNQAFASPATYIALCTAEVTDADTGSTITEPGNGYARAVVNPNGGASPAWALAAAGLVDNLAVVNFNTPTGAWGTLTAMAIVDAATLGNLLFYDTGIGEVAPASGDVVRIPVGGCDVSLS
jgi:hypothetical protein